MFKIISNLDLDNYLCMEYSPIEKSFSIYKNILRPNCQSFTEDSLSKNMIVNFFITN
jgi:hypothetical protein